MSAPVSALTPSRDFKVIGLVSTAHFMSHFYMLLLPPLFPVLRDAYGVGYTELGLAITAYSASTGITQAPVGFLVDRYGARLILIGGLVLQSIAIVGIALFPFYEALVALMVVSGIANAVYHPADYAILNASVDQGRMGRAFSLHTFAGYLGSALAPVTMLGLIAVSDWRVAVFVCGAGGLLVALALWMNSGDLLDAAERGTTRPAADGARSGLRLLFSLPIVLGLLFYMGLSLANQGLGSFGVSVLATLHEMPLTLAGALVSAYLFASPAGVLVGGWVADRIERHDRFVASSFLVSGAAVLLVAVMPFSVPLVALAFVVAGFCWGAVAPSRDMLIRSLTPPGQEGKVFGFVSTGFNVSGIVGPPLFGYLLDSGRPSMVFVFVACVSVLTMFTVLATGRQGRAVRAAHRARAV